MLVRIKTREDLCSGCLSCVAACSLSHEGYASPSSARLQVRDFHRTRTDDEGIIPYLARKEWWKSPVLEKRIGVDPKEFRKLLDELYCLRGWSVETGRPRLATLQQLGLSEEAKLLRDKQLIE